MNANNLNNKIEANKAASLSISIQLTLPKRKHVASQNLQAAMIDQFDKKDSESHY